MTQFTLEKIQNIENSKNTLTSRIDELQKTLSFINSYDLNKISEKLKTQTSEKQEVLVTAHLGDKVVSNKVSVDALKDFSLAIQFNKVSRQFFRHEEIHQIFSKERGLRVFVMSDSGDILSLEELIKSDAEAKVFYVTPSQLLLVDEDNTAYSFESDSYPTNDINTSELLKGASIFVSILPTTKSVVEVDSDLVEIIEDGVCGLEQSINNADSASEILVEHLTEFENLLASLIEEIE